MNKQELELHLWKTIVPRNDNLTIPDVYTGIEDYLETNNIEPEFRCAGAPWDPIYKALVSGIRPKIIFEVGSYIGYSAIKMAEFCKAENIVDASIVCIDPWLDVSNHVDYDNRVHGYSSVYHKFLHNVKTHGHEDIIIPLPLPALSAYRYLRYADVKADLIYIDGSHDYDDVYIDVSRYYTLLNEGGMIFGDDWTWEGVREGVQDVCRDYNIPNLQLVEGTSVWFIKK